MVTERLPVLECSDLIENEALEPFSEKVFEWKVN